MHRITAPDGSLVHSPFLRWTRMVAYVLMSAAGILMVSSDFIRPIYGVLGEAMAWFLIVGGLLSAFGAVSQRWIGEFTGLPLLAPSFIVFGVLTWRTTEDFAPLIAAANLSLLLAIGIVMLARWRVVLAIHRFAVRLGKELQDE